MACAFSGIQREDRRYPLNQPECWTVKYPRWTLQLPDDVNEVSIAYVGIQAASEEEAITALHKHIILESQAKVASLIEERILKRSDQSSPKEWERFYVESGYDIPDTEVYVFYWTSRLTARSALERLDLQHLLEDLDCEEASTIGVWIESFTVPKDRFETIYSGNDYQPGVASLKNSSQVPHTFTGYWGAARDRIPASCDNTFQPQFTAPAPNFTKDSKNRIIRGHNHDVLLHIRSGQYWEICLEEERQAYESMIEPLLRKGMKYLEDNAEATGNFGLRFMRNITPNRRLRLRESFKGGLYSDATLIQRDDGKTGTEKRLETCVAGFFRSLKDLEMWAATHRTHHKIFHGIHAHSLRFGKQTSKVRTWHEVGILNPGEVEFEYINCHPRTGLLPFVEIDN